MTTILWHLKVCAAGPHHPVFFYLLPTAVLAIVCGSVPALLCASAATACAAFFLYDPLYSFYVAKPLEYGDLICFAVLAVIGVKCTSALLRPSINVSAPPRFGRPVRQRAGSTITDQTAN